MARYFAYGSNMCTSQMSERCPDAVLRSRAELPGFRIAFTRRSVRRQAGVADIVRAENSSVWGLLFDVTDVDGLALDRYEGHPKIYRRLDVRVTVANGSTDAFTYEVVDKEEFVAPSPDYLGGMIIAAQEHGFPETYIDALRSFALRPE